jgi:Fe-S-cluster containining protein
VLEISQKSPFYAQGLHFACTRCSDCCRHDAGYVFLSGKDVSSLQKALKTEYGEFIENYCRWIPSANGTFQLSLKEKSNFDCVFWLQAGSDGGCSVYEARPLQCRAFPFWPAVVNSKNNWNNTARACPGMNKGALHSGDSIKKWLAQRQNEPIITKSRGES